MQTEINSKEDIQSDFHEWCICEFMGHLRIVGFVTETNLFGTRLVRVDIPTTDQSVAHTEYFGGNSIYRLSPVGEVEARELLTMIESIRPVTPWELARLQSALETKNNLRAVDPEFDFEYDRVDEDEFEDEPIVGSGDKEEAEDERYDKPADVTEFECEHWVDEMEADHAD